MKYNYFFILTVILFSSCSPKIIEKSIPFDEERTSLSVEYLNVRYGLDRRIPWIIPQVIVVHWTAIPTFDASYNAFVNTHLPSSREKLTGASSLNVSAHYLIDRDGKIYQLMPNTLFGRHTIGLNHSAIGIENVGGSEEGLTEEQFKANLKLIRKLTKMYDIDYVIGHHEYQKFIGHELWLERDPNYLTEKSDPGDEFMNRLRKKLKRAHLKPIP